MHINDEYTFFFTYEKNNLAYDTTRTLYAYIETMKTAPPSVYQPEGSEPILHDGENIVDYSESSDYTYSVEIDIVGNLHFKFVCVDGCTFVDIHYRLNQNGVQQNIRMRSLEVGNVWTYNIQNIEAGTAITYYFTHEENNLAYDTNEVTYTMKSRRKYLLRKKT